MSCIDTPLIILTLTHLKLQYTCYVRDVIPTVESCNTTPPDIFQSTNIKLTGEIVCILTANHDEDLFEDKVRVYWNYLSKDEMT